MATNATDRVFDQLRRLVLPREGAGATDAKLLGRFIENRDESAFEALLRRHGPMVWGVCRRILANRQDAEDAFQATFLVLVRKATSVRPREMVGNWLYGVAQQTAVRARALNAKRRGREKQVNPMPDPPADFAPPRHDWQDLLDRELSRLPDKYRAAIVLCDLEGKTRTEAARQLGWPEGSVSGRLARGRAMLAERLAKYGPPLSVAALAAELAKNAASASPPAAVTASTLQAASALVVGQAASGLVSADVVVLVEGVTKAMLLTKLKTVTVVLFAASLVCGGVGGISYSTTATAQAQSRKEADAKDKRPADGAGAPNVPIKDTAPPAKKAEPKQDKKAAKSEAMFPDGRDHDFGQVFRGQTVTHRFRIVNTTNAPLKLLSVRAACGCATGSVDSQLLVSGAEGKLVVTMDASRFVGQKAVVLYLFVEGAGGIQEYRFDIRADSQVELKV
jgi:RNA polymerase sigma factor (sigma-70 family)